MKAGRANAIGSIVVSVLLTGAAQTRAQATQEPPASEMPAASVPKDDAPVVEIRIVAEDGTVLSKSPSGLPTEIGKPLDRTKVRESLHLLYRTGDYADLRAVAVQVSAGVRLDFIAQENLFFNRVLIRGLTAPPSDASAAASMQLALGQVYRRASLDEGRGNSAPEPDGV
jgi:outer membrane protein assembly factor BamA